MRAIGTGGVCAVFILGVLVSSSQADPVTIDIKTHQGAQGKVMTEWSKEFSGPEGYGITGVEVWEKNSSGGADNVTGGWTWGVNETEDGRENLTMRPNTPVSYCTWLIFRVSFNDGPVGVGQASDRQYDNASDYSVRSQIDWPGQYSCMLDSACYAGGPSGRVVSGLGLIVPANEYAYVYQINDTGNSTSALVGFALDGAFYFHDMGYISAPHNGEVEYDNITDYHSGEQFEDCGMPLWSGLGDPATGQQPDSWELDGTWATAAFNANPIDNGLSSVILVAFSPRPPRMWGDTAGFVGCEPSFPMYANWGTALAPEPLPGDADGDSKVDSSDLAIWQQHYDPLGADNDPFNGFFNGDFDRDGKIDSADLALWQQNYDPVGFMMTLPPDEIGGAIPEPTTLALVLLGSLGLLARRKRRD